VAQNQLVVSSCLQVMEDALKGMLVVGARVCSMSAKRCNGIGEVQSSHQHRIHKGTESLLICLGINGGEESLRRCSFAKAGEEMGQAFCIP